jgi:hypothetical protein
MAKPPGEYTAFGGLVLFRKGEPAMADHRAFGRSCSLQPAAAWAEAWHIWTVVTPSLRTPLNFFAAVFFLAGFFTAMNSPEVLLRLVHADMPPSFVLS